MAKLFLTDYASYNEGKQFVHGHWVDLDQFADADEFQAYQDKHFADAGISDPEPMYTDFEEFPEELYSEAMSGADLAAIFDYIHNDRNIYRQIDDADADELVGLWNTANDVLRYADDKIYPFDEDFFDVFFDGKPMEAARATAYGDVNFGHDWIMFDGYANLKTFDDPTREIDTERIIEAYKSSPGDFE